MRLPLELALPSPSSSTSPPTVLIDGELFLLELQGELELSSKDAGDNPPRKAGQRIGKLDLSVPVRACSPLSRCYSSLNVPCLCRSVSAQARPTLLIGHHRLVGKLANLPAPMAILKHTLPISAAAVAAPSQAEHPPTSSPTGARRIDAVSSAPNKRTRADSDVDAEQEEAAGNAQPSAKRLGVTFSDSTTPARPSASAAPASSPASAALSSSAVRPPAHTQTPVGVSELKRGSHQIVGIITRKIIFSKRPEPVVNIAPQSSDEDEDQDEDSEEQEEAA